LAVRDLVEPWPVLKDETYPILQGPFWSRPAPSVGGKPFSAATFADILAVGGFARPEDLAPQLRAWDGLFDTLRPDLALAEYAPAMVLAARGRLPAVMFGTGFTMPPADIPEYPRLQSNATPVLPPEKILATVQEVQLRRGRPVPQALPEVLACERRFPCTFPEIDPYRAVRREAVLPPLGELPAPLPFPDAPRFFVYLAAGAKGLPKIIDALGKVGLEGAIFIRGLTPELRARVKKTPLRLFEEPQPMAKILPIVSAIVHHAGAGTTEACLAAGRAQVLFPQHLEQSLTTQALHGLGVGLRLTKEAAEDAIVAAVRQAATDAAMRERAAKLAATIAARGPRPGVAPIVAACEELLLEKRPTAAV
jgi:hypothetical protein